MVARSPTAVALDAPGIEMVRKVWGSLMGPGSFFDGVERLAIAHQTRAARGLAPPGPLTTAASSDAARRVAGEPWSIRPEMIDVWAAGGLDGLAYLELVSVVVRVVAVDAYISALGLPLEPLPSGPGPGAAHPVVHPDAARSTAWVPTVGPPHAGTALSALPDEAAFVATLHDSLYLAEVIDPDADADGPLSRPQMELIASRTSWLNECFY